jgi:hypothetical protein
MPAGRDSARIARQLQDVAAELDQVTRQVRGVEEKVGATLGSSATGADKRMLSSLSRVSGSTREAQQALSAAASALRKSP